MNPIIALDDSISDFPIDLDTPINENVEPELPEESIDQLLERANLQITSARTKMETRSATAVSIVTVRATSEMEAAINSVAEIDILNVTDDDVIFVEENVPVINLCSPDKGPRSSRYILSHTTAPAITKPKSVPQTDSESANAVMCAVCMESSVGKQPNVTKCGHIFCGECIKEAIKITRKCPLCNKFLTVKNIVPVYI